MKKKNKKPFPLTVIENLKENYPSIDLDADDFKSVYNFLKKYDDTKSTLVVQTMLKLRKEKQIFEVDEELCNVLMDVDKLDDEMPSEVFNRLVYDCFYVKFPNRYLTLHMKDDTIGMDGFFYTVFGKSIIITMAYETYHMMSIGFDYYEDKTLRECIDEHLKCNNDTYRLLNFIIQIVLYLCADNADVEENYEHKEIYKPVKKGEKIKDTYSEIRKWDVGYRYGAAIKKERQAVRHKTQEKTAVAISREGSHSRKRTHVRRGHYHHFWRGSQKDGTRELIIKWISPVVINAEYENIATIRKVKMEGTHGE